MSWNLQQINNANGNGPTVPGVYLACPQATAAGVVDSQSVCAFGDQQHFAYFDKWGNVQDCWYDGRTNSWHLQQINNASGNGATVPGEYVACPQAPGGAAFRPFVCTFGDQQHFAYPGGKLIRWFFEWGGDIQDCWYDGRTNSWHLQQINNTSGGDGPVVPDEYLACPLAPGAIPYSLFVCVFQDQQHFAYQDITGNIQDCWYDGRTNSWHLQQINNANGNGPTMPGEYVACPQATAQAFGGPFVAAFGDQQHFVYVDEGGNVQDCWYDGRTNSWHAQQINNANGNGATVPGIPVVCPQATAVAFTFQGEVWREVALCTFGDQLHVAYLAANPGNYEIQGDILDCWYDGTTGSWHAQQINNVDGKGAISPGVPVVCPQATAPAITGASVSTFGDQQHFAYQDITGNIQDCWYDGRTNSWHLQQINNANGNGATVPGEYVACPQATAASYFRIGGPIVCTFADQQHFVYIDVYGNIQDCYWTGGG
jgi:dTDP-4-dehydrorhamnose 3,5-epimerase-like enzyme